MAETPIKKIEIEAIGLANKIGATKDMLPDFGVSTTDSKPFVLIDGDVRLTYHYIIKERGIELEHSTTLNRDMVLYFIFRRVAWNLAQKQANINRDDIDPRRLLFAHIEQLLGQLNPDWQKREESKHQDILLVNPFDDNSILRANFIGELRKHGTPVEEATMQGYERYPKPTLSQ